VLAAEVCYFIYIVNECFQYNNNHTGASGDPFRSVEVYDWRRDRWFTVADMNTRRRHVGLVSAQHKL
jgi:hypothetical protein